MNDRFERESQIIEPVQGQVPDDVTAQLQAAKVDAFIDRAWDLYLDKKYGKEHHFGKEVFSEAIKEALR